MKVTFLGSDDRCALYIEGEKVFDGSNLYPEEVLDFLYNAGALDSVTVEWGDDSDFPDTDPYE